ncbi:hypothetical protein LJE71_09355 [Xanthobacter autotrophicus]|uniref:hypothetical protein n=1 Tax=Xanthobacter autotrophicus TaxID=280 RepID=UPI001E3E20B4|nr:hypothetical protein [Xanthobacter autotrophicus]UDQ91173.1 hypothetical protein LJE71_09355 [Xanthobacter autotrophicus]
MTVEIVSCFPDCPCSCGDMGHEFDRVAQQELRVPLKLRDLCSQKVGWYSERSLDSSGVTGWGLGKRSGLYFLWYKNGYCDRHDLFHMRALYVGKGAFSARLRNHWASKDTSEQLLIYFTYVELPNRIAKYVEQLLLDIYKFPLNSAENRGTANLCAYLAQRDVD